MKSETVSTVLGILSFSLITTGVVTGIFIIASWDTPKLDSYIVYSYTQEDQEYKVTAYCPCEKCCGIYADGITASGYRIKKGDKFCASPLPFNTLLKIPGYGIVPVLDRGGAIKENCIDVYFDTHQEALNWGVQYLKVGVVK